VSKGDDPTKRLREAIDAFGAERAAELVAEAQAEALAKARTMLSEAMVESLLGHSTAALGPLKERPSPAPRPRRDSGPRSSRPRQSETRSSEIGHYVYGIVYSREDLAADLVGVDPGYPVTTIESRGLAAVASRVALDEFGEEPLRENLNDVTWLEDKARAHEQVLEAVLKRATVVPMRLCTIYSGEDQVREMLGREREMLLDALERLDGKAEWGVKAIAEPGALERAALERSDLAADEEGASSGVAYLNRKRREAAARVEEDEIANEWAEAIHEQLARHASDALLNPLQRPEVSGYDGEMVLNGVYLVDDAEVDDLRAAVERLQDDYRSVRLALDLTGPWPPYNFVKSSIEAAR
jgi:hypothetical protein